MAENSPSVETPDARTSMGRAPTPRSDFRPSPLWRHMLGDELRRLRRERGETLGETANTAGISPQYLSEMERGVKDPSSEMIDAVAGALGVTLIDLASAVAENLEVTRSAATARVSCRAAFALAA